MRELTGAFPPAVGDGENVAFNPCPATVVIAPGTIVDHHIAVMTSPVARRVSTARLESRLRRVSDIDIVGVGWRSMAAMVVVIRSVHHVIVSASRRSIHMTSARAVRGRKRSGLRPVEVDVVECRRPVSAG